MSARNGVGVVGGGAWGLALAAAAARTGKTALVLSRRAHDGNGALPRGVTRARDLAEIAERARLVLFAVPSSAARESARALGDHVDGRHVVVHGVRGLVGHQGAPGELETIGDVIRDETPVRRIGALGGPALVDDLLAGRPSVLVCGSQFPEVNHAVHEALSSEHLRLYTTEDRRGLEWASALVGCLAIGIGYAQSLGASPGLVAALLSRAVHEASRLAAAAGGEERTLLGLAGYGDLLASIGQERRPEVMLGHALAEGTKLDAALASVGQRIEAVDLIPRVAAWAEAHGVRTPIFAALARGVLSSRPAEDIVHELMTGPIEVGL
jgi:glycerol-3-phosphate dehydrogenase (NAD(P)+)